MKKGDLHEYSKGHEQPKHTLITSLGARSEGQMRLLGS